ncbi:hypothetical protein DD238_006583 [Peronospora effusa]|uniref:Ig-like domain-containing protein n=1 Tax=Peronospora effusa TaxID=542832 RepID=A0A3M6VQI3_9STRA|nr:hypothetical protein DD238_006583 [Peronospora effusa]
MAFFSIVAVLQVLLTDILATDMTSCWKINGSTSSMTTLGVYNGSDCAVDVTIFTVAASYVPKDNVAMRWGLQLNADSTNAMDVPIPPNAMATLDSDTTVQILSTYVRTCVSRTQCMPSIMDDKTFTTAQSGNFSSSTDMTYFETLNGLSFEAEGNYTVAAVAVLGNSDNTLLLYYFQSITDIFVTKQAQVEAVKFDGHSTYCRVTAQNPIDYQLRVDALFASSESSEVEVIIGVKDVVQANRGFDVVWIATLSRNVSKEIILPSPLKAISVGDKQKNHYTVVSSLVKMCERDVGCNEYSRTVTVSSAQVYANFTSANTVSFHVSRIVVPSIGWYTGFAQVTLAGNDVTLQRYDLIKYFEIFATEENAAGQMESENLAKGGSESYCWGVGAGADSKSVDAASVMFSGKSSNCPYTINMTASTTTLSLDDDVIVSWTVARQAENTVTGEMAVNGTTVYDVLTNEYVNLPQGNIYYCNGTKCSPFSEKKTLMYSAPATNFSAISGMAQFSSKVAFSSEGTYALMAHAVVPNGDDFRFDVASQIRVTVTAPAVLSSTEEASHSNIGLIVGLPLGCAALVCLVVFGLAVRRRRTRQKVAQQKEQRHSFFGFPQLSNTNELASTSFNSGHGSDASGHFMYRKAQRSPLDMPRASSLSYDLNSRTSFVKAGNEVSGYSFIFSDSEPSYSSGKCVMDVAMSCELNHHQDEEMDETVSSIPTTFSTPCRRQDKTRDGFKFSVTPESSRQRLSTSRGRTGTAGLEESPARYSPSKVKAAVRSFADFLHFLEQEEHQQEHALMPVIIQRFAELGAVIESQKRHIDRWKGKELDLAIEEAQQNLELIRELGETIEKQELQIAGDKVEKQKWEEKYQLAAQEIESLKKQGTYQIQQLRSEVAMLRQAGVDVETKLKERDVSLETLRKKNDTLHSQLERLEHDSSVIVQENTTLKQQRAHQSDEMHTLEQEIDELREHSESLVNKATELEQDVKTWQTKYEEKEHRNNELENALNHSRQKLGQREGDLEHLMGENRKLQEHIERMAQEHEKHLAEQHKYRNEAEAELQRLNQTLQQESTRFQNLKKEAGEMRAQIEAQAMSAMSQREQQLLDEKSRLEEELQHQFGKINEENIELRAKIENLKDTNRRQSTEIGQLMATSQELNQQYQSRNADTQRMQQLTEELARAKYQIEHLVKETATKDSAHEETMKSQSADFENQYNNFVSQVEGQLDALTRENEQLRSDLDEAAKKLDMYEGKLSAQGKELDKWRKECETLQHQLQDVTREYDSLKRELDHNVYELELQKMKNAEVRAQTEQFLSPDNEFRKEVELLQSERVRLEEQNQELQRHIEAIRVEADARLNEAQQVHNHSREQEAAHENTVRLLYEEKEAINRNMMDLASEKSALEFQVMTANNDVERWKSSVQQLENDKRGLEFRIQEVMRQATEQIETQKHSAAMATEDGRTQLQTLTAHMNEGHYQVRSLQETITLLEEKLRAQQYEYESLRMKNEQLSIQLEYLQNEKRGLEDILPSLLRESQSGVEEDLSQKLERFVREMDRQVQKASEKAVHLQAVLDSKLESEQLRLSDERTKLEEENAKLQRELANYAAELEKLDAELLELQREREKQNHIQDEMHQTIAAHEAEKWARSSASNEFEHLEAAYEELKTTHDRTKTELMAQLNKKEIEVADLRDDVTELQSRLDQEKEMSRHLMDRSHNGKQERTQIEKDLEIQMKELEVTVKYLQHKLQVREQSAEGNEYQARVKELEVSVEHLQHELEVSESTATEQQAQVKELEALVKQLQDKLKASEKIAAGSEHQARVKELEAQVKHFQQEKLRVSEQQSAESYELQTRVDELETQVKQLQHELQVSEQSITGREQRVMHEKLQKEREYRSMQARYDNLAVENATTVTKLDAKVTEVDHLHQEIKQLQDEIEQLQDEIERLHVEIRDNTAEMDNARSHLHVSEELSLKLENMQNELTAHENEAHEHKFALVAKDKELQHARKDVDELKCHLRNELQKKEDEVASLKRQNLKFQEQLKQIAQAKLTPKRLDKADSKVHEPPMREDKESYERLLQREEELTLQIAHLKDAKSAILNQFRREMRKLNIECSAQGSPADENNADDSDFHRGMMKVSALLRSFQDREAHQNALISRKEKHINKLKMQLLNVEQQDKSLHQQVEAMSREVSKLNLEHKELRESPISDSNGSASELSTIGEWKEKCTKLKHRVRELKEANTKLKEIRFSKSDMKALVKKVEKLTSQVLDKDVQIQALRNREMSKFTKSGVSTGSRRSRDLLVVLKEKEQKIMVLNDHLTGLMTENMRLQHSTEQYVIRYGPMDGAMMNGVIGNSGIRVPYSSNRQEPDVRSQ